ncbi:MAG: arsenate reductase ArsC [Glaciecola sp.]|jgi:arsenate reductase|nr:arsenate reductase ArsC [Glaciecola sp.]MDG1815902.1 arsenate reductase ArsC [Glaciecola sp.]MDG2098272.1 arsenate reductase ArsC [Glaciecola sp.]
MKILYICTHNRCRSILSEAITNHASRGLIQAKSAGSQPVGEVHPLSIKYLAQSGISVDGLQSQSWNEFEAFAPDVVVTVCDSAAAETCPVWFGDTITLHWGLSDPSKIEGSEQDIEAGFLECIALITERVEQLTQIAQQDLSPTDLKQALSALIK